MKKKYCIQNGGNCETCSLTNYGKDCMNVPLSKNRVKNVETASAKKLLRPDEVASYFSVSKRTVYYWIQTGQLEAQKVNGTIRIHRDAIGRMIKKI